MIRNLHEAEPFVTKDGSEIRSILDLSCAPVANQSLAEAYLPEGNATERHYHQKSEEFYFITDGRGLVEIEGEEREVKVGDGVLIPAGAWHQIRALTNLRFLCCCAPPYSHEDTFMD